VAVELAEAPAEAQKKFASLSRAQGMPIGAFPHELHFLSSHTEYACYLSVHVMH
jgi:hypothetical protein